MAGDTIGRSLAIDGTSIYTGCLRRASVYVWSLLANQWAITGRATPASLPELHAFPWSVAVSDGRIVGGSWIGNFAHTFDRNALGEWIPTTRLTPSQGGWYFGWSVAIHGDVAVVGAPNDFSQGQYTGAAFVFERDGEGNWLETQRLLPSVSPTFQAFGGSVAVGDDVILVGASTDSTAGPHAGAAYIFTRTASGAWVETQQLLGQNLANSDFFGVSVALDGDLALVGAEGHPPGLGHTSGAVFVYHRQPSGHWTLIARLMAEDPQPGALLGRSVALRGNLAVVGAPFLDVPGADGQLIEDAGAAYIFAVGPDADGDGTMDVCACLAAGDLDVNGVIGLQDLLLLLAAFGSSAGGDLDGDGDTDLRDLSALLSRWGQPCP